MRRLILRLIALAAVATPGSAWTKTASPYVLDAPAVWRSGDFTSVRGRVCRMGLGPSGAPVVEISRMDGPTGGGSVGRVRLDGDLRGRAGGCTVYSARLAQASQLLKVCVHPALTANRRYCKALPPLPQSQ